MRAIIPHSAVTIIDLHSLAKAQQGCRRQPCARVRRRTRNPSGSAQAFSPKVRGPTTARFPTNEEQVRPVATPNPNPHSHLIIDLDKEASEPCLRRFPLPRIVSAIGIVLSDSGTLLCVFNNLVAFFSQKYVSDASASDRQTLTQSARNALPRERVVAVGDRVRSPRSQVPNLKRSSARFP
jgi:hypothetical protein